MINFVDIRGLVFFIGQLIVFDFWAILFECIDWLF